MAFNPDDTFSKFLEFCKPYLELQKSTELIKLLQKRFSDCKEEYKKSLDFADLTEITCAKIESDSKNIFIHLRDYLADLKSNNDKKRKREANLHDEYDAPSPKSSKGETSDVDSDGSWNKFIRKTATACEKDRTEYSEVNKTKEVISNVEEQMCITIDDSDEDTESGAMNLTVTKLQNSTSKQPDKSHVKDIDKKVQNHTKNISHTNKLKLVQSTTKTQTVSSTTNICNSGLIQKFHKAIDSTYYPAKSKKQYKLVSNTQLTESDKCVNKHPSTKPLNDIETIVLDDDDDEDEDKNEDRNEIQNMIRIDKNLTSVNQEKNINNKESSHSNTNVKEMCETIDIVNSTQDTVNTEPSTIQIIEKETKGKQLTDKETNDNVDEVKGSEQKTEACTQQKIQSSPKVETSEKAKSECRKAELTSDKEGSQISKDCKVVVPNYVDKAQKETSVKVIESNIQKASETEKSDVHDDKPISSLIERNENSENENQETKKEESHTGTSEKPNDQHVARVICNGEHAAKEITSDQHAAKEIGNEENVEAENGSVANVDKQDEQKAEKAKTGSKKQIARLEKLLEDLRNKIEGLKEREVTLDEMDDECSSYILEDKYQQKFVKVWKKLCELKNKSAATGRPIERRFKYSGTRYPEINRKLEKFVNKRKEFPDYHDVKAVITKVNQDKKIGLGSTAIERLAREAFLDVGESLQKRRRQDLAYTSAGHIKVVDRLPEDPASHDPELKKKLNENRKHYKEKMEQVMSKYADIATATEPIEEENQSEEEDEEEETSQNIDSLKTEEVQY
ncbi:DDT domain-containing protein DDB_G0282237-like isoform X2 [Mytilus californianus]|uniref:DDT domain-containing protein DDB_G0282237-like isoform X2 n=1 Tax=Mytilus californianus TaxID=6549 RepID=UPI002248552A|nr:DDT domain-containing protein DDB_G0282237-like isoform X2 [Mytilus californianus]